MLWSLSVLILLENRTVYLTYPLLRNSARDGSYTRNHNSIKLENQVPRKTQRMSAILKQFRE
jgi:hypothetical protein